MKQNNFLDALELSLSFYDGTAMAVIGGLTLREKSQFLSTFISLYGKRKGLS